MSAVAENYELQVTPRGAQWGYVVTISTPQSAWTSPWRAIPGATQDEAARQAVREARALKAILDGAER